MFNIFSKNVRIFFRIDLKKKMLSLKKKCYYTDSIVFMADSIILGQIWAFFDEILVISFFFCDILYFFWWIYYVDFDFV